MTNTIDKDILQVAKSISRMMSSKWRVLEYDECLSECYLWIASNIHRVEAWQQEQPSRWRASLGLSLKNELNRLGGKESEYYTKNSGVADILLGEDYITDLKKEQYLSTPDYYITVNKLEALLYFTFKTYEEVSENEWEQQITFAPYKEAQAILTDINQATYSLTPLQKDTITLLYVDKLTNKEVSDKYNIKEETIKQRRKRLVKLLQLKLQSGYSSVW